MQKNPNVKELSDSELLDSFRHPKRDFLDKQWLSKSEKGTYNDNSLCNTGYCKDIKQNEKKDVICNVVQFGKKLEQCTNQEYSVSIDQLDKISNNSIAYDEL